MLDQHLPTMDCLPRLLMRLKHRHNWIRTVQREQVRVIQEVLDDSAHLNDVVNCDVVSLEPPLALRHAPFGTAHVDSIRPHGLLYSGSNRTLKHSVGRPVAQYTIWH